MIQYDDKEFIKLALQQKYMTQQDVDRCVQIQKQQFQHVPIGDIFCNEGVLDESQHKIITTILRYKTGNLPEATEPTKKEARARDRKLSEVALREGLVTQQQLVECVKLQRTKEKEGTTLPITDIFLGQGYITEEDKLYIEEGAPLTSRYQHEDIVRLMQSIAESQEEVESAGQDLPEEAHGPLVTDQEKEREQEVATEESNMAPTSEEISEEQTEDEQRINYDAILEQEQDQMYQVAQEYIVEQTSGDPVLSVIQGPDKDNDFTLSKSEYTIGRVKGADIRLNDNSVSRIHCKVQYDEQQGWVVVDMMSSHGVYINGKRIRKKAVLYSGDKIQLGKTTLQINA